MLLLFAACAPDQPETSSSNNHLDPVVDTVETGGTETGAVDSAGDTDPDSGVDTNGRVAACEAMVSAADALLAALTPEQADAIRFDAADPNRHDWSNLPVPRVPRDGVQVGQMSSEAAEAAWGLLSASLSDPGYQQALDIVALDDYADADGMLGSEYYTWAIYGTPSSEAPWAWQFDGHHLVYDFSVSCPDVYMAPNLLGAEPLTVPTGPLAGLRALADEQDDAFALLESLDPAQRSVAILGDHDMRDLVAGPGVDGEFPDPAGLPGSELTLDQQVLLLELLTRWVEDQEEAWVPLRMAEITADLEDTWFLWIGGEAPDTMHYYRLHGPTVFVEWDCASEYDHVHAVYRNPVDDYGGDVLGAHYARTPHAWAR